MRFNPAASFSFVDEGSGAGGRGWYPPDDYRPIRGVCSYLLQMAAPQPETAEAKLLRVVRECRSPRDVGLNGPEARALIDRRIVPTGIYPYVLSLALEDPDTTENRS